MCADFEHRILDYLEQRLSPALQQEVRNHLAQCGSCRKLAAQFQRLDSALSSSLRPPRLTAGFEARLWERTSAAPAILSPADCAVRRRQLQAEFEASQPRLRPDLSCLERLLDYSTWPAFGGVVAWLAWFLATQFLARANWPPRGGLVAALLPWTVSGLILAGFGLAAPQNRKWLLWENRGFRGLVAQFLSNLLQRNSRLSEG